MRHGNPGNILSTIYEGLRIIKGDGSPEHMSSSRLNIAVFTVAWIASSFAFDVIAVHNGSDTPLRPAKAFGEVVTSAAVMMIWFREMKHRLPQIWLSIATVSAILWSFTGLVISVYPPVMPIVFMLCAWGFVRSYATIAKKAYSPEEPPVNIYILSGLLILWATFGGVAWGELIHGWMKGA